ncbi:hypothetical protein V6R21_14175 [Limibacter armeniacum]|uniref:hypothetical protein n=1 Tax=Limibacter armeniacum TaxID=466084 RepID=UPI002FE60DD8
MRKLKLKIGLVFGLLSSTATLFAQGDFPGARIRFSDGKYTNERRVKLKVAAEGATEMRIGEDLVFSDVRWMKYTEEVVWMLSDGEGEKIMMAQFKDDSGKLSDVVTSKITLDNTPPSNPYIKIDVPGKYYTNKESLTVGIILKADGAKFYEISNHNAFHGKKWQLLKDEYAEWDLEPGFDGPRTVYVRFRDVAGNVSLTAHDEILLDRTPPMEGTVEINGGQKYTIDQTKEIVVKIMSRHVDSMAVAQSEEALKTATWEAYKDNKTLTLEGEDGEKSVFVKFKDIAGNETRACSDNIILDTTPPTDLKLEINNGAKETDNINKEVSLSLGGVDVAYMIVSNHPSFSDATWRRFQTKLENWKLSGETDGIKTVYAKFKDEAGNISSPIRATISLKRGF